MYPQYYGHYRQWHQNRYQGYNDFYYRDVRSHSSYVSARIKEGHYKSTYSHPEQRRDGEALYAEMYPDHNTRTQNNTVNRSQERRSVSQQTQGRTLSHESSDNISRSINTNNVRAVSKPEKNKSVSTSRRTLNNYSGRAVSEPQQSQRAETSGISRQSSRNAVSLDRKSTKLSKAGTAVARRDNAKESEADKKSRRK
jgi:hypothetical protein